MLHSSLTSWKETYQRALRESDAEKLQNMVGEAEEAIFRRFQELEDSSNHNEERTELNAAAADLLVIKTLKLHWPSVK